MREVRIGDFVETIHGVNGILTSVKNTYYGLTAYIATADGRNEKIRQHQKMSAERCLGCAKELR